MSNSIYQIDKLNENNYDSWKVLVKSVLIHSDLWSYVAGVSIKPGPEKREELASWSAKDEKALATILLCVKPSQINYIKNCTTSAEAWKNLEKIHQPKGPARKVTLFKQLLQLKMEGNNVQQHINNFFDLAEKIKELSIELQDELLAIILLSSLPSSYENFIIAIESRDQLPSIENLKVKLLEEGHRRGENEPQETSSERVLFLNNRNNRKGKNKQKNAAHQQWTQEQKTDSSDQRSDRR